MRDVFLQLDDQVFFAVIPAKAGIHCCQCYESGTLQIPAFAGMTVRSSEPAQKI
jgi:hypothetical protein